ncbi:hypothetical protein A4U88_2404 [Serratia marcescens]|nr:hypothetical protein A4U88_2404 [Serratia marcescens]
MMSKEIHGKMMIKNSNGMKNGAFLNRKHRHKSIKSGQNYISG